jgi:hydroxylamine reductase
MVTNVNFDPAVFVQLIAETVQRREHLKRALIESGTVINGEEPVEAQWLYEKVDQADFVKKGETVGVHADGELSGTDVGMSGDHFTVCVDIYS